MTTTDRTIGPLTPIGPSNHRGMLHANAEKHTTARDESVQAQITQTPPIQAKVDRDEAVAKLISCTTSAMDGNTLIANCTRSGDSLQNWKLHNVKSISCECNVQRAVLREEGCPKPCVRDTERGQGRLKKQKPHPCTHENSYGGIPPPNQDTGNSGRYRQKGPFLETFFPKMEPPENETDMEQREEIPGATYHRTRGPSRPPGRQTHESSWR
jgi:hypothetical protein